MRILGPTSDNSSIMPKGLVSLNINPPIELTASRTMTDADSGTHFLYNGTGTITLTFPSTLSLGFTVRVSNAGQGTVLFDKGGRLSFGNASRDSLIFQWDVVEIFLTTANGEPIFLQTYNLGLPVLFALNNAVVTRNTTTMTAIPGMTLNLIAGGAYDIDIIVPFTTTATANSLRIGIGALPASSTCQLEAVVWNTATAGTAPKTHGLMMTPALGLTGVAGTASVASTTLLARITGRIYVPTSGTLTATCAAISTASTVTVAAQAATMSISKVFDLGRT